METILLVAISLLLFIVNVVLKEQNKKLEDEAILLMKRNKTLYESGLDAHKRATEASALISRIFSSASTDCKINIMKEIDKSADILYGKRK